MITGHDEGAWSASVPGAGNRVDDVESGEEAAIQLLTARLRDAIRSQAQFETFFSLIGPEETWHWNMVPLQNFCRKEVEFTLRD